MKVRHIIPVLLGTTLAVPPATAEDAVTLDTIVVTASRADLPERAIGSAVTVVTEERARREQAKRITDLLRDVPGVQVSQDRPGAWTSISIRGSDNGQVLVLMDGVRLGDPSSTETAFQFDHLDVEGIDRIEVLRGNQSSLYGSDAIGGVVNIMTRRPVQDGWRLSSGLELGPDGWRRATATLLWKRGDLDARVSGFSTHYDGPSQADPRTSPVPGPMDDDAHRGNGIGTALGWQIAPQLRAELTGLRSDTRHEYDSPPSDGSDTVEKDEWNLGARILHENADRTLRQTLSLGRYNARRTYHTGFSRPEGDVYDGTLTRYGYDVTWKPAEPWSLVGGVTREKEETLQITNYTGSFIASNATTALFTEAAWRPDDHLTLTAAVRRDDNDQFGTFNTWRLTGAYLLSASGAADVKLRASYGTGAKAPGLYQLYDPTYGNPDLTAQRSRGWDIGADVYWPDAELELGATYFQNRVKDKIAWGLREDGSYGYYMAGRTREKGIELSWQAEILQDLLIQHNHTWVLSHNDETGQWRGQPKNSGALTVSYRPGDWSVGARLRYASRNGLGAVSGYGQEIGGYGVTDLLASYRLDERAELYGRIENVLDKQYQTSWGYNTNDRSLFAGIRLSLQGN
ncbi:TonB-dependent receptor plug domain-containing protein [Paracoccus pantotrophus]|uniref:TonB-dependent receptor plug domain-containing protein n=1 Tax=Paracoccus pantotrophus TaxID=82367 RepID=UPI0008DECEE8|nr:TonB-dependent receptor [Paracoccus pantotrophus]MDF3856197.1 TonB-dependent receptor [Paracoccus pantotrophus]SFP23389.1 vitamin B12 transporter [Paracoccus pantotrophus]